MTDWKWNWDTMTEAQRNTLWSEANRRRRAEECLKTAETVLATISAAVEALGPVVTDTVDFTDAESPTPTPVTVTWAADEQRAYLDQLFQVQLTFLTEYDQVESFQLDLQRREYGNHDDWLWRGGSHFVMEVMWQLFERDGRYGPEMAAVIAMHRLEQYRRSGVTLTPDGWVTEWDDPHTNAGKLAKQEREEREEKQRLERQQVEDEREAWKQFQQEKSRELAAVRQAEREAQRVRREASWRERDEATATGRTD
jgi:hypothetical protein